MLENFIKRIAAELQLPTNGVRNTIQLLSEDATIPFISRYRKERTGGLDEVQIGAISDLYDKLTELDKRKKSILSSIDEQEKLTPELKKRIEDCWQMNELEDLYLPYKPKRHTRAEVARQKGLEPLAKMIMEQNISDVERSALPFVKDLVENVGRRFERCPRHYLRMGQRKRKIASDGAKPFPERSGHHCKSGKRQRRSCRKV